MYKTPAANSLKARTKLISQSPETPTNKQSLTTKSPISLTTKTASLHQSSNSLVQNSLNNTLMTSKSIVSNDALHDSFNTINSSKSSNEAIHDSFNTFISAKSNEAIHESFNTFNSSKSSNEAVQHHDSVISSKCKLESSKNQRIGSNLLESKPQQPSPPQTTFKTIIQNHPPQTTLKTSTKNPNLNQMMQSCLDIHSLEISTLTQKLEHETMEKERLMKELDQLHEQALNHDHEFQEFSCKAKILYDQMKLQTNFIHGLDRRCELYSMAIQKLFQYTNQWKILKEKWNKDWNEMNKQWNEKFTENMENLKQLEQENQLIKQEKYQQNQFNQFKQILENTVKIIQTNLKQNEQHTFDLQQIIKNQIHEKNLDLIQLLETLKKDFIDSKNSIVALHEKPIPELNQLMNQVQFIQNHLDNENLEIHSIHELLKVAENSDQISLNGFKQLLTDHHLELKCLEETNMNTKLQEMKDLYQEEKTSWTNISQEQEKCYNEKLNQFRTNQVQLQQQLEHAKQYSKELEESMETTQQELKVTTHNFLLEKQNNESLLNALEQERNKCKQSEEQSKEKLNDLQGKYNQLEKECTQWKQQIKNQVCEVCADAENIESTRILSEDVARFVSNQTNKTTYKKSKIHSDMKQSIEEPLLKVQRNYKRTKRNCE